MGMNRYIKSILADELRWKTRLTDDAIMDIVESFARLVESRRHAIVPTYMDDEMYDAVNTLFPNVDFSTASRIYRGAVLAYDGDDKLLPVKDDTGSFW